MSEPTRHELIAGFSVQAWIDNQSTEIMHTTSEAERMLAIQVDTVAGVAHSLLDLIDISRKNGLDDQAIVGLLSDELSSLATIPA